MAVAYQSSANNSGSSTSINVNKPTGLAVGDLLMGVLVSGGTSQSMSGGGGSFNQLFDRAGTSASRRLTVWSKIADASDVAASTFSFSSNNAVEKVGLTIRITGQENSDLFVFNSATTNSGTSGTVSTITPDAANSLFLLIGGIEVNLAGTVTTYAMATSNPTWNEIVDTGGTGSWLGVAYANRSSASATGTCTVTFSASTDEFMVGIIAIQPSLTAINTVNGLAKASVKTVDELAIASVKSINGLQ